MYEEVLYGGEGKLMAKYCVMCGLPLPNNQGSNTCSLCYGDPYHGKDYYYFQHLHQLRREEEELQNLERKGIEDAKG